MSNAYNDNDPRLKQDTRERKDKENTNAGMIAGVIIVLIGLVGIYLFYKYEATPITNQTPSTRVSQPATVTPATTTEQSNTAPATTTEQSNTAPATTTEQSNTAPATTNNQ